MCAECIDFEAKIRYWRTVGNERELTVEQTKEKYDVELQFKVHKVEHTQERDDFDKRRVLAEKLPERYIFMSCDYSKQGSYPRTARGSKVQSF